MGRSGESCRMLFKELKIVPCTSQYKLSLLLFVTNNKIYFMRYSEKYNIRTGHSNDLHLPQTNLAVCQKGVYYSGVKMFNNFPSDIKNTFHIPKKFKIILRYFLITCSFYTIGGILFQTIRVVDDSFSIQFQVLFNCYSIFNSNFIKFCISCFILLFKFTSCVYVKSTYTYNYLLCCIVVVFCTTVLPLVFGCIMGVFDLYVFMPLYYTYY